MGNTVAFFGRGIELESGRLTTRPFSFLLVYTFNIVKNSFILLLFLLLLFSISQNFVDLKLLLLAINQTSAQSYKHFTLVNYDSSHTDQTIAYITPLESQFTNVKCRIDHGVAPVSAVVVVHLASGLFRHSKNVHLKCWFFHLPVVCDIPCLLKGPCIFSSLSLSTIIRNIFVVTGESIIDFNKSDSQLKETVARVFFAKHCYLGLVGRQISF